MTMPRSTPQQRRRPPAQVYTRGTVGAVKTRQQPASSSSSRRSRSQTRLDDSRQQQLYSAGSSQGSSHQSRSVQSSPSKSKMTTPYNLDTTKTYIKISKRVIEGRWFWSSSSLIHSCFRSKSHCMTHTHSSDDALRLVGRRNKKERELFLWWLLRSRES